MSELLNNFSSSLLTFYQFILTDSNSISVETQNAYKLNQIFFDVLIPSLHQYIDSNSIWYNLLNSDNKELIDIKNEAQDHIIKYGEYPNLNVLESNNNINKISEEDKKKLWNDLINSKLFVLNTDKEHSTSFNQFDLSQCVSIVQNIFNLNPRHGWFNEFENIKLSDFNVADAFNYSKIIRNKFYGHTKNFETSQKDFDDIVDILNKIFDKLQIDDALNKKKEEIIKNQIIKLNRIEQFTKWQTEATKVSIESSEIFKISQQIDPGRWTINTKNIVLYTFYIQQCLKSTKYICFDVKEFIDSNEIILKFLESDFGKEYNTILIYCSENEKLGSDFNDLISKNNYTKTIIIIGIDKINSFNNLKLKSINFNDLNDNDKKKKFLKNKVNFFRTDKYISFDQLIGINNSTNLNQVPSIIHEIFSSISDEILEKFFQNKPVNIFDEISFGFDEIERFYIKRTFRRYLYFERNVLSDPIIKKKNCFVFSENDFDNEKKEKKFENIHLFENNEMLYYLKWIKTHGKISKIEEFSRKDVSIEFDDNDLKSSVFDSSLEKILILCDEPGMGKTTVTKYLVNNIINHPADIDNNDDEIQYVPIYVKLNDNVVKNKLRQLKEDANQYETDLTEIICKDFLLYNNLQCLFFKHFANSERLIVVFDGLDQIIEFKDEMIKLINILNQKYKLKKIIITARNHLKKDLENEFGIISYNLIAFSRRNQIDFLKKYWSEQIKNDEVDSEIENFAIRIINHFEKKVKLNNKFIEVPLQIRMLADIFLKKLISITVKERVESSRLINEIDNLSDFYNKFVFIKCENQFAKRENKDYKEESFREDFFKYHYYFSFKTIFNQEILDVNTKDVELITKYGIITEVQDNVATFFHQSFAEFFIAKMLLEDSKKYELKVKLENLMITDKYFLIRKFLDEMLIKTLSSTNLLNLNQIDLFNIDDQGKNALHCASKEGNANLAIFLISKGINIKSEDKNKRNPLHIASMNGHKEVVELLISKGIDINSVDRYQYNSLHMASKYGHKEIAEFLISKEINLGQKDENEQTALHAASKNGHKDVVELLISKGFDVNELDNDVENSLHVASRSDFPCVIELLISSGVKINKANKYGKNALHLAAEKGNLKSAEILISKGIDLNKKNKYGMNALHISCIKGSKGLVELLVSNGIGMFEEDNNGNFAFNLAAEKGHKEVVEFFISKGIELECYDCLHVASLHGHEDLIKLLLSSGLSINSKTKDLQNSLHFASKMGHIKVCELLILNGIELQDQDEKGENALHITCRHGHKELAEFLISKSININEKNKNGQTALHIACQEGHCNIVELLISKGADINEKTNFGKSCMDFAEMNDNQEVIELLIKKGFKK